MVAVIPCPECDGEAHQERASADGFAFLHCLSCSWESDERVLPAGYRSLEELLADPVLLAPPVAVVPFLAWQGRVTLLAAREKLGKSILAGAAAAAVASGRQFLGRPVLEGSVLWLALEEHAGDVARRFQRFKAGRRVTVGAMTAKPFDDVGGAARALEPTLVVVDTLAALASSRVDDPSSSTAWTKVMTLLTAVARETGSAVLLLHHSRKSDGTYRDSTAIGAGCDVLLEMKDDAKDSTLRRISGRGRIPIEPEIAARLVGDRYELAEAGSDSLENQVLTFLGAHPGSSSRAIRDGVSGRAGDIDAIVRGLFDDGSIVNNPDGRGNAYSLTPDTARDTPPKGPGSTESPVGQGRDTMPDTLDHPSRPESEPEGARSGRSDRRWSQEVPCK